ncbi:MAG: hypothetical protein SD837_14870 [Candidatus Electrothrix scaldis]|nr:MAG: hypothetical protein SD837_14870 [Candidatus Electrothrix sp. GW3-3]
MKTKKRIIAISASLIFFFLTLPAFAVSPDQPDNTPSKSLEEYCQTAPCRKNHSFKLKLEDGTFYEHTSDLDPPAVQPAFILIFPGEKLFIEATEGKDAPQDFKHVPENIHPERTLVFKFTQTEDEKLSPGMFLNVHNPFARDLRYRLAITPLGKEGLFKTSSCPVLAGKQVFEHWPYPLFQVAVADIHFLKQGDDMSCRE